MRVRSELADTIDRPFGDMATDLTAAVCPSKVRSRLPDAAERIHLLSLFADGTDADVPDPIGGPVEEYESAYRMIESYLKSAFPKIVALDTGGS